MTIQRTLVILKPDAIQRGYVGEILTRFEKAGMKIIGMKMLRVDDDFGGKHYHDIKERKGEEIFKGLLEYIKLGPVLAFVLEGVNAIENVRKIVGGTEPKSSPPGTIRGDYAHMTYARADDPNSHCKSVYNLIHASADEKDAEHEIHLWFSDAELHEYKTVHEMFM